jgi:hypothetical protein
MRRRQGHDEGLHPRPGQLGDPLDGGLARRARAARESRDREILDGSADDLNREMEDVLAYQADV